MISSEMEKYIMKGVAEYRTFTVGGGAVGTVPVPQGGFIVITDFIWHPFIDVALKANSVDMNDARNTKQLQLRSGHKNVNYILRDQILYNQLDPNIVGENMNYFLEPKMQIHCFHKFTEDVFVDITVVPETNMWVASQYAQLEPVSGEPAIPNGYGIGGAADPTLKSFSFNALSSTVNVVGEKRNPLIPYPARATNEFHCDYGDGVAALANPVTLRNNGCFPIITFGFVQFNTAPTPNT